MNEHWLEIPGFESFYEASSHGRIRSVDRVIHYNPAIRDRGYGFECISSFNQNASGKVLKQHLTKCGYLSVCLHKDGEKFTKNAHRLVASAFIPNPSFFPQVNHIDGNKQNNAVSNLEWCTASQNFIHALVSGLVRPARGESKPNSRLKAEDVVHIRALLDSGMSQRKIAAIYNCSQKTIGKINTRETWLHV